MRLTRVLLVQVVICYCVCSVFGKKYETRCKLVRELLKVGVPNDMFLGQCKFLSVMFRRKFLSVFMFYMY